MIIKKLLNALCNGLRKDLELSTEEYERIFVERYELLWYCKAPEVNRKTLLYQELSLSLSFAKLQLDLSKSLYWYFRKLNNLYGVYNFLKGAGFKKWKSFKMIFKLKKMSEDLEKFDSTKRILNYHPGLMKDLKKLGVKETIQALNKLDS